MFDQSIDSKSISVVVRGLVVGANESDARKQFTCRSLQSVRKFLPHAQLILSTWKGSDVDGLDYDILILNDEPEKIFMAFPDGTPKLISTNNQIITSSRGLKQADREYVLSMRSDIILTGTGFINYFVKYNNEPSSDVVNKKVVVLPTYNPRRGTKILFDVCDWFYFGTKNDVTDIFDIPFLSETTLKGDKINGYFQIGNNFETETYIWSSFLKKHTPLDFPNQNCFSDELLQASEESYAKYTIMLPANMAEVVCLKMPQAGYGARPWLSQGLYTFSDYINLNNKYCSSKIISTGNLLESAAYSIALCLRRMTRKAFPGLYKILVNFIRRLHGSFNFIK